MSARDRLIATVVAGLLVIAAGWLFVVSPRQDESSRLGDQVTAARSALASARGAVTAARGAQDRFAADYATVARLGEAVPSDDATASLLVELQQAAHGSHVDFRSLQVAGSGTSAPPAPSAATAGVTATLPPGASVGSAGLATMPFSLVFRGDYLHLTSFLGQLQSFVTASPGALHVSGRLLSVNSVSLGPAPAGFPQIVATINATGFLTPASQGLTAGATPLGPDGAAAAPSGGSAAAVATSSAPSGSSGAPAAAIAPIR